MAIIYSQKQSSAQKKDVPTASSVLDASSQSESLQRKADMANNAAQRADALRPNNTGMPDNLKSGIESLSGFSMDDVRVHYNSSKPATVQALAYTQGTDIHVAPGQEKHLPHEAWHVAQQMAGRVSPTTNINGMPVNDNAGLEHEADVMGEKAVGQMFSINKKTDFSSTKKYTIQNHSIRQTNSNTKQNVTQCVHIKVHDNIVLPDQSPSRSRSASTPPVVNKVNSVMFPVPAAPPTIPAEDTSIPSRSRSASTPPIVNKVNSVIFPVPAVPPTTPAESNSPDNFIPRIRDALHKIKDEYYVQKLLHFSDSIGVKIVPTENDQGCGWENGKMDGDDYKLVMDLEQCNVMFWGTPTDYENAPIKNNVPIYLTLLHELGHAYQFYLQKQNQDNNYQIFSRKFFSGLDNSTKDRLKKYPLFLEALNTLNTTPSRLRLYDALYSYGIKEPLNEIYTLIKNDNDTERDKTIKKILDTIEKIALVGNNPNHDSDNLFMNEIPYTTSHTLPIRKHYSHSYLPSQDKLVWKFEIFLEEQCLKDGCKNQVTFDQAFKFFKDSQIKAEVFQHLYNATEIQYNSFWNTYIRFITQKVKSHWEKNTELTKTNPIKEELLIHEELYQKILSDIDTEKKHQSQKQINFAKKLHALGLSYEYISEATHLSVDEIKRLLNADTN